MIGGNDPTMTLAGDCSTNSANNMWFSGNKKKYFPPKKIVVI
jgi:hypothetical protein